MQAGTASAQSLHSYSTALADHKQSLRAWSTRPRHSDSIAPAQSRDNASTALAQPQHIASTAPQQLHNSGTTPSSQCHLSATPALPQRPHSATTARLWTHSSATTAPRKRHHSASKAAAQRSRLKGCSSVRVGLDALRLYRYVLRLRCRCKFKMVETREAPRIKGGSARRGRLTDSIWRLFETWQTVITTRAYLQD